MTTTAPSRPAVAFAWTVSIFASLLVDAAAVFAAVRIVEFRTQLALELSEVPGEAAPTSSPSPVPTPTVTAVRDSRVPVACDALYSRATAGALTREGLELETIRTPMGGTADVRLLNLLDGAIALECDWHESDGGVEKNIRSSIAVVDDERTAAAIERILRLRMTGIDELEGVRYFTEGVDAQGRPAGESHFFRDGLWFATQWHGHGPRGYTAGLVRQVFD